MKKYLILPECDDSNRGDQALIWETVHLAQKAGYNGTYYMLANSSSSRQSQNIGILNIPPVLRHPSHVVRGSAKNIRYGLSLKLRWGMASLHELICTGVLLNPFLRVLFIRLHWLPQRVRTTLEVYNCADAAFVKGGGFLHAYGGIIATYQIYYFLYHIRLALSFGIPVYILPNSFGPLDAPGVRSMIRRTLEKCEAVCTREHLSQQLLKEDCGFEAHPYSDIAFLLPKDEQYNSKSALLLAGIPIGQKPIVAITVRPYRFPEYTEGSARYDAYKHAVAGLIRWLHDQGLFPVLVEHTYSPNEHEQDIHCINEIRAILGAFSDYAIFSNHMLSCTQMKAIYGQFDFTVGTRFHSVIFSLSEGVPSLAIAYGGNKSTGIMADIGLGSYVVPIGTVSQTQLIEKFREMVVNREQICTTIQQHMETMKQQETSLVALIKGEGSTCHE